jgi:diguanylate cyclase
MQPVIKTLLEQMRITDSAIKQRMDLLSFTPQDSEALTIFGPVVAENLDVLVEEFYRVQTSIPEIALLIGDSDTLGRLQHAQRKYILDLFSGSYDLEYVNNRLRIGLVHKRIGVEPKLYLSATRLLKNLLLELINDRCADAQSAELVTNALDKLLYFDVTLIVETYIRSMLSEIESAKEKSEQYAQELEERSRQLEGLSQIDPLTGLLNRRSMAGVLARELIAAQSRSEPVSLVYIDIDHFKRVNDQHGHKRGDEVLHVIGEIARATVRSGDTCFRIGGDEFCILMPHCDEASAEEGFCARFRQKLHERIPGISVSIGVHTTGPTHFVTAVDLIEHADAAMFTVKRSHYAA